MNGYLGTSIDFRKAGTFISEESHCALKRSELRFGDVLITIAGTIGRIGFIDEKDAIANCNQAVAFVRIDREKVDAEWLCYLLQSPLYQDKFSEFVAGGAIPNVSLQQIKSIEIPALSVETQRQIAARLKAQLAEVEKARQAAEAQLRDANALKAKALESIFGIVGNKKSIGLGAKVQSGYAFKSESFRTGGVRLLRNANILPGKVYWDETVFLSEDDAKKYPGYDLNDGDVLISLDRPIISSGIKVARVGADDLPALLVQRVGKFILDPKKLDADYLYAYLQTDLFIKEITGHDQSLGVPHISPKQVENIEIPMPDVNVQRSLSGRLTEVLKEWKKAVSAIREQEKDLSILPQKILAQAFEM